MDSSGFISESKALQAGRTTSPVRVYRTARGLTQAELADLAGITPQALRSIEKGRSNPRVKTAKAIAEVLGITLDALFPELEPSE